MSSFGAVLTKLLVALQECRYLDVPYSYVDIPDVKPEMREHAHQSAATECCWGCSWRNMQRHGTLLTQ